MSAEWRSFFDQLRDSAATVKASAEAGSWGRKGAGEPSEETGVFDGRWPESKPAGKPGKAAPAPAASAATPEDVRAAAHDSIRALMLIRSYRVRGHLQATLDPLGMEPPVQNPELTPEFYGFSESDLDKPIFLDAAVVNLTVGASDEATLVTFGVGFAY